MRYTNSHNLPQPLYEALTADWYDKVGDISVTSLISPPLMRRLQHDHAKEITEDAAERVWMLLGSSVHGIIERHGDENRFVEERLTAPCLDWMISGKTDLYEDDDTISDYKVTSVYAFLLGNKPEWEAQLNCYAWLYRQSGFTPRRLQIVAILRDWVKRRAMTESGYPQCAVHVQSIPLWPNEKAQAYVEERILIHRAAQSADVKLIQCCNESERWQKPADFAVKKKGNKRATRVFATVENASAFAEEKGKEFIVEVRPSEPLRCLHYCSVAQWCPFGSQFFTNDKEKAA